MSRAGAWRRAGVLLAAVLVADQVTKALARGAIDRGGAERVLPFLELVNIRNEGVAFGIAAGGQALVVVLIAVSLTGLVAYFATHASQPGLWVPAGLLAGGALGNVVDRVREGAVTDFLKVPYWPAFNVADIAITVGVVALLYVLEGPGARRRRA